MCEKEVIICPNWPNDRWVLVVEVGFECLYAYTRESIYECMKTLRCLRFPYINVGTLGILAAVYFRYHRYQSICAATQTEIIKVKHSYGLTF